MLPSLFWLIVDRNTRKADIHEFGTAHGYIQVPHHCPNVMYAWDVYSKIFRKNILIANISKASRRYQLDCVNFQFIGIFEHKSHAIDVPVGFKIVPEMNGF